MKKIICLLLVFLICFVCAGCGAGKLPAPLDGNTEPTTEIASPPADGISVDYARKFARIRMTLPEDWQYEIFPDDWDKSDSDHFGILFRPTGKSSYAALDFYVGSFGVCGTGLSQKIITTDAGYTAYIGMYDGESAWDFVWFRDAPGCYVATNNGLTGADADRAIEILNTAVLGQEGSISEADALRIGLENCTVTGYSYETADFNYTDGSWEVRFGDPESDTPLQTVVIGANYNH